MVMPMPDGEAKLDDLLKLDQQSVWIRIIVSSFIFVFIHFLLYRKILTWQLLSYFRRCNTVYMYILRDCRWKRWFRNALYLYFVYLQKMTDLPATRRESGNEPATRDDDASGNIGVSFYKIIILVRYADCKEQHLELLNCGKQNFVERKTWSLVNFYRQWVLGLFF